MSRVHTKGATLSFRLRLTARGGRDAIEGWTQGADGAEYLKARVTAAAEHDKANDALITLVSAAFDIAKSAIRISAGQHARMKTIEIAPASPSLAVRIDAMETAK